MKKHLDTMKFAIVGVINTAIDFGVFNLLTLLTGMPAVIANVISTGCSMVFSFTANKQWTFDAKNTRYGREIVLFVIFTIISMWVINSGIVWLITSLSFGEISEFWQLNIAKIIATLASMTWNYFTYKYIVFKKVTP